MKFIKANVFHRRNWPKANKFLYKCNYVSIKLPAKDINTKFFSLNKLNILSVNEKDYANGSLDLFKWCAELIEKRYKNKIDSLELITMPKILGYAFNPVSFIFCYSKNKLICTILKVNNTFSEDHYYINYAVKNNEGYEQNYDIEKLFHVSPFLPREGYYKIKYKNDNDCINFNIDYYNRNNENIESIAQMQKSESRPLNPSPGRTFCLSKTFVFKRCLTLVVVFRSSIRYTNMCPLACFVHVRLPV